jgi:hypothetical protein
MAPKASYLILMFTFISAPALLAEQPHLTAEDQARLARQFAPVLVFNSAEKFFPASPFFSFDTSEPTFDKESTLRRLGTTESRTEAYLELNLTEKGKVATVFYRAYPARRSGVPVVVLEYWFYYVRDEYRVRANILPVWMGGNHPNDLEHVHLVLRQKGAGNFVVDEALSSAHEGKIPANRFQYDKNGHDGPTHFFVELGSHALAPDIDEDGIFTPGIDGDSGSKLQWGIRDRGYTWLRYRKSYMSPRSNGNSVVFEEENAVHSQTETEGSEPVPGVTYRLASVDSLNASFARLDLTNQERKSTFESPTFWFPRVFGRNNGRSKAMLMPAPAKTGGNSVGILGVSASERFFLLGATLNVDEPGFLVGGRYSFLTRPLFIPDFVFETDGMLTRHKNYLSIWATCEFPQRRDPSGRYVPLRRNSGFIMPFDKLQNLSPTHIYSVFLTRTSLKIQSCGKFVIEVPSQVINASL